MMATFASNLALAAAAVAAGLAFGLAYFAVLRRTTALYGSGGDQLVAAALTLARIAGAITFFAVAVRFGSLSLLAAFLGFLLARTLALRAVRRTA